MIPTKLSVGHRSAEPYNRLDYMTKIIYIKKAIRSYNTLAYNFLKKYLFLLIWVGFWIKSVHSGKIGAHFEGWRCYGSPR